MIQKEKVTMSRETQKERRRANRRLKRQAEHQQRMAEKLEKGLELIRKSEMSNQDYGHNAELAYQEKCLRRTDPTAYYAANNIENNDKNPRYGL